MKLIELFENSDKYLASTVQQANSADEIAEILEYECSQMVDAYRETGVQLFRGIKEKSGSGDLLVHAHIRPDRRPVVMDVDTHNAINAAMIKLGLKAHRGNSIFCTTNLDIAHAWGAPFMVFAQNGWTGTYFKKVKRDYVFDRIFDIADRILDPSISYPSYESRIEMIAEKMQNLMPETISSRTKKLNLVLANRYEDVLITGKAYYGLNMKASQNGITGEDVLKALSIPYHKQ